MDTPLQQLASLVYEGKYRTHYGCAGYDTRPYFEFNGMHIVLPVHRLVTYAQNGLGDYEEYRNLEMASAIIDAAPKGATITVPDYMGCTLIGLHVFTSSGDGEWDYEYDDARDWDSKE